MKHIEPTTDNAANSRQWIDLPSVPLPQLPRPDDRRIQGLRPAMGARLVISPDTPPVAVEQYRRLAAVMHQAQHDRGIKTVMIASAYAGEGKTLTAANLALTLSESYRRRVLLIDADLRRPMMHDIFQIPNLAGLSDGLKSDLVRKMPLVDITPTLSVLPGGRPDPDPMSGLTSERMKHVTEQAAERFDWVILDTPPVMVLPDSHLVAGIVDTVVFVIRARRTPLDAVKRAVDTIGQARIIGVVLNQVEASLSNYVYYADTERPVYTVESEVVGSR